MARILYRRRHISIPRTSLRNLIFFLLGVIFFALFSSLKNAFIRDNERRNQDWTDFIPGIGKYKSQHYWRDDGMLEVNMASKHPIIDLMARADRKWKAMIRRQSKTLEQAVNEYKRRYGRLPPKGFDLWYEFASSNNVQLIDEFDQINFDIEPFLALPPSVLEDRVEFLTNLPHSFHITIAEGHVGMSGPVRDKQRSKDVARLIEGISQWLPDMEIHGSGHDKVTAILRADQRAAALQLARTNRHFTEQQLIASEKMNCNPRSKDLANACSLSSYARFPKAPLSDSGFQFIADHNRTTMNYCMTPSLLKYHGAFNPPRPRPSTLDPVFVHSKDAMGSSILMPALAGQHNFTGENVVPWSSRNKSTLFWRGQTTGGSFNAKEDWRVSHRIRLHQLFNSDEGEVEILVQEGRSLQRKTFPRSTLNEAYMDVGLVSPPIQCKKEDGTCDKMNQEIRWKDRVNVNYGSDGKFALDVDGNGWSQRYQKLLASGSVVLKATVYPEWNTDWLVPYYHYIPVQVDYSDIYNIMAFFVGAPGGGKGNDRLAERISRNGVEFAKENWRWVDTQAYMYRLLLEYARACSMDREEMTYKG